MKYSFEQFYKISDNVKEIVEAKGLPSAISETLQKRILKFLSQSESDHEFISNDRPTPEFKADIEHICDFLSNLSESEVQKQIKGSYEQIFSNAQKWSEISQKRGEKLAKRKVAEGQKLIHDFGDGYAIWHLASKDQLEIEGNKMGHCVGGYNPADTTIYSLRDKDNEPHATLELSVRKKYIKQIKGKSDRAPIEKYQEYIRKFIKMFNFEVVGDGGNIGLAKYLGKFYDPLSDEWKRLFNEEIIPLQNKEFNKIKKLVKEDENGEMFIDGDVDLSSLYLEKLPKWLKSVKIGGYFNCATNQLTSLEGAPKHVRKGFYCNFNQLTSLRGAPEYVGDNFYCGNNQLTSLEDAPEHVGGSFYCFDNQLTSLEGAPKRVEWDFICYNNRLTSLQGAPEYVGSNFDCSGNQLTSLQGAPKRVDGSFDCSGNQLTSFDGAPEYVRRGFRCINNQPTPLKDVPVYKDWKRIK